MRKFLLEFIRGFLSGYKFVPPVPSETKNSKSNVEDIWYRSASYFNRAINKLDEGSENEGK